MKMWRERLEDARERGHLDVLDVVDWCQPVMCPAAEACQRYGLSVADMRTWPLWRLGSAALFAAHRKDFVSASDLLDAIDDLALELKREIQP